MNTGIKLSADERSVLLFCIDEYCNAITHSESVVDDLVQALNLPLGQAESLHATLYTNSLLTAAVCSELSEMLWAWEVVSAQELHCVREILTKLQAVSVSRAEPPALRHANRK